MHVHTVCLGGLSCATYMYTIGYVHSILCCSPGSPTFKSAASLLSVVAAAPCLGNRNIAQEVASLHGKYHALVRIAVAAPMAYSAVVSQK